MQRLRVYPCIDAPQQVGLPKPLKGDTDWTQLTSEFASGGNTTLQLNLLFGAGNRHQHAREKLRTIDQQFEVVAFTPGKNRSGHVSAP